jgi:hypothetical protein
MPLSKKTDPALGGVRSKILNSSAKRPASVEQRLDVFLVFM